MATKSQIYGSGEWMKATQTGGISLPGEPKTFIGQIASVSHDKFDDGRQQAIITWTDPNAPKLGLNATNWDTIADMSNRHDDAHWGGLWIEVFVIRDSSGMSKTGHTLRVRQPTQQVPQGYAPQQQPYAPAPQQPQWQPPPQGHLPQPQHGYAPPQQQVYQQPPMPPPQQQFQPPPQQSPHQQQQFQPPATASGIPLHSAPSPQGPGAGPSYPTLGLPFASMFMAKLSQLNTHPRKPTDRTIDIETVKDHLRGNNQPVPEGPVEHWPQSMQQVLQQVLVEIEGSVDIPF